MTPLPKSLLPFFWHFAKPYKWAFALFAFAPLLMALETSLQPYGMKLVIDGIGKGDPLVPGIPQGILLGAGIYIGCWFLVNSVYRVQEWVQTRVMPKFQADIRMQVVDQLSRQSYSYFTNQLSGNLSNKISDLPVTLDQIRMIFFWCVVATSSMIIASIIIVSTVSLFCALVLIFFVAVYILSILFIGRRIDKVSRINAEDKSQLNGRIVDMLTNILPVKLFARRGTEIHVLQESQDAEIVSNRNMRKTICSMRFVMDLVSGFMVASILAMLIWGWKQGVITAGDVALVMFSMIALINQLWYMAQNLMDFFRHIGVAKQALVLITEPIKIQDAPGANNLEVKQGEIVFDKVNFQYHDEQGLFSNKSVTIQANSKVGLVGYSGSGKTTFVQLILRFFDLTGGQILIDGQNIAQVKQDSLHENIVMVPQDTTLFHRNLRENIAYGNPQASEAQIIQAAKDAHCHEFISTLPQGYETLVGERGIKLSGGQRQRIAIARAMLKPSPILILDEATSALDSLTEKYIQEAMHRVMQNRTTLVVAHRLSTLAEMDRILVFDKGRIIEDGSHAELLALNGHYAKMWAMQAGGFLPTLSS